MHLVSVEPLFESCAVIYKILAYALSSFRMFNNEDVTIGSWMLAMNVKDENTHALVNQTARIPQLLFGIFQNAQVITFLNSS
jgi:hypothetical protein